MTNETVKHTPGPWKVVQHYNPLAYLSVETNSQEIGPVLTGNPHDALLIASSPDLLEACKVALDSFVETDGMCHHKGDHKYCVPCSLKYAIAKSEGK